MQYTVPLITSVLLPIVSLFTIVTDNPILEELKMEISRQEVFISLLAS